MNSNPPDGVFSDNEKQALSHAWNWFSLHAAQRMQCFNFFLIATAFMTAAYATLFVSRQYWVAFAIATLGFLFSVCFHRLEVRTKTRAFDLADRRE